MESPCIRRRRRSLTSAVLAVPLLLGPAPAPAFHANELPLIVGADGVRSGWASIRAISDGSKFVVDLEGDDIRGPFAWGMSIYDENEDWYFSSSYWGYPGRAGVAAEVNTEVQDVEFGAVQDGSPYSWTGSATFNDPSGDGANFQLPVNGEISIVAWWAGNADWSWSLRAQPGSTVDAIRTGSDAFIYTARDFESMAHVQAYVAGNGGRAQAGGNLPLDISNTLIGVYGQGYSGAGSNQISVTTPRGEQSCDLALVGGNVVPPVPGAGWCWFLRFAGPEQAGPGDYTFHASGAGVGAVASPGLSRASEVALHGADAALPGAGEQLSFLRSDPVSSSGELVRANPDGAWPISVIGQVHGRAAWSPDGRSVVVARDLGGGDVELAALDAGGTSPTVLTADPGAEANPRWSRDGSRIAFDRNGDIFTVETDGSQELNLTAGTERVSGAPDWSPGGNRIVFHSIGEADGDFIYVMDADGGNVTPLAPGRSPTWSPDGGKIAFERDGDLYAMSPDGTDEVRLTDGTAVDGFPAWSPDGSTLAFTRDLDGDGEVFVMAADGTGQTNVTNAPTTEAFPSWRPGRS